MDLDLDVAIVGAGFAGLACAARLRSAGVERLALLEQGDDVGAFWRGNYDRIRLHSAYHDLPDDGGIRRRFGAFMARDQLLEYFEAYTQRHRLRERLHCGERVRRLRRAGERWEFETSSGRARARFAVVATAYNRKPVDPKLGGRERYTGRLLHSREYRNATPFRGARVLVVGNGNSAAEIALDLAAGGARAVALHSRGPRHVISMRALGFVAPVVRALGLEFTPRRLEEGHHYTRTHPGFAAKLEQKDALFRRFSLDLSRHGIRRPEVGPATLMLRNGRVPWFDQGTVAAIRAGRIDVIDGVKRPLLGLGETGAQLGDREETFEAIVLGTGFEPGLDELLEDADRLLYWNADMARRMPNTDGRSRSSVEPTLFFPGFDLSANGGLSLGLWGREVADTIAREL